MPQRKPTYIGRERSAVLPGSSQVDPQGKADVERRLYELRQDIAEIAEKLGRGRVCEILQPLSNTIAVSCQA